MCKDILTELTLFRKRERKLSKRRKIKKIKPVNDIITNSTTYEMKKTLVKSKHENTDAMTNHRK